MREQSAQNKMGTEPLLKLLIKMSLPAMFSMMIQALYNLVDSYFVGRIDLSSDDALTAVGLAFPIQNLLIAFAIGTAVGASSLIARRLGEGRKEDAEKAAAHGLVFGFFTSIVFAILGALFSGWFIGLFSSNADIIKMGTTYTSICCIFSFGSFVEIGCEKILQATGNMIWPMIFQLIGAISNIILDPILIFGYFGFPAMGVAGAAIATVGGQILAMIISIVVMLKMEHDIHVSFKGFRFHMRTIKDIYIVGIPTIIMQSIGTIMTAGMNLILAGFAAIASAAQTVFSLYFRVQSFVFMPLFGMTQGLMPILAYNFGARNEKRVLGALKRGIIIALIINTAGMIMFLTIPDKLLSIFNVTQQVMDIGVTAFRIICLSFLPAALGISVGTLFQATGKGIYSLINSLMRQLVILLPMAWALAKITKNVAHVWWAFPIADIISLIVVLILLRRLVVKQIRPLSAGQVEE